MKVYTGVEVVEFVSSSFGGIIRGNDTDLAERFGDKLSVRSTGTLLWPTDVTYTVDEIVDLVWDAFRPELKADGVRYEDLAPAFDDFLEHMAEFDLGQERPQ